MKRLFSCVLVLVLMLTMIPTVQAAELSSSGDLDREKPTKAQISAKLYEVTESSLEFEEAPSVAAPYAAGRLSDEALESGITYLNYIRYVANLPQVQLDDALNNEAQHGAVLLAAIDTLTHYPHKPDDMDDDFYAWGYAATTSSNISVGYGSLQGSISGCVSDSSGYSNRECVGHRRWLLNPWLLNVGFGYAEAASGWPYMTTKVFDTSGDGCDFDFISWPASGNFPSNLFGSYTPWSVTLNPWDYQTPVVDNLQITITREDSGECWNLDASTGETQPNINLPYLTVNTDGYAVPNCIIFYPGADTVNTDEGVYTVHIRGLYTADGQATELRYQVEFFDAADLEPYAVGGTLKKVDGVWKYHYQGVHLPVTTLVKHGGSWYYVNEGVVDFDYAGLLNYNGGQYYVKNGKVASNTTALVKDDGQWFYVVKGKVASGTTALVKHNGEWFYVVKGKVASKTTTLVKHNGEWFYVVNGKIASKTTTLVKFNGGWYYIYKGKVAAQTTTLVKHSGSWFYVKAGKVDFGYSGRISYAGGTYTIRNGKVV